MTDKMHFIIIDDSKLDCFIAEKIIHNTGISASVKSFMVAAEALDYIRSLAKSEAFKRTVILVDIQMPLMNGFDFLDAFETDVLPENKNNYVINLLSSSINESDKLRAKSYKTVNTFLSKPLTVASLMQVLDDMN